MATWYGKEAKDILKAAVESLTLIKVEDQSRLEVWKSMMFPERYGTPSLPTFFEFLQNLMSGNDNEKATISMMGCHSTMKDHLVGEHYH